MQNSADARVLVTGASGFIAKQITVYLLQRGYRVRGTVRSLAKEKALRESLAAHVEVAPLELVEANLDSDAGWSAAAEGCRYVLHVASPFPPGPPGHEDELIRPACEGTRRVLAAAVEAGVERVVMTSSVAAVSQGVEPPAGKVFGEQDWSDVSGKIRAYGKSKTLAERAAWDFMAALGDSQPMELTTINPSLVVGPLLDSDSRTSAELIRKALAREIPGCPNLNFSLVDVRDVAEAHVRAMTAPGASGRRIIMAQEPWAMRDMCLQLDREFRDKGYPVRTFRLPDVAVRLFALFDRATALVANDLGRRSVYDIGPLSELLGMELRPAPEAVRAMAESLIARGVV